MHRASIWTKLALAVIALPAGAQAAEQTAQVQLVQKNFDNYGWAVGLVTSDFLANPASCKTVMDGGCTAEIKNSKIPKNIGNALCVPSVGTPKPTWKYTSQCQALIDRGSDQKCQKNSFSNAGPCAYNVSGSWIGPTCNWRTTDDANVAARWVWTVTASGSGEFTIDCTKSGYSDYSQ